jgi:magnesium-transporting ATPase (P-type)
VKEAVEAAKQGNIRVVMITGDYVKTAIAIAKNVNILGPDDDAQNEKMAALDCGALRPNKEYLPDDQMDAMTHGVKVFARAKPEDKLEIVKSFQRMGLVSAMTGDGVNDAPALNKADIGVAMGIQGTDVAKGASDMILMDDDFSNIVAAVEKGRVVYAGIQKFVAFIMSVHVGEVMQIFVCVCAGMPIMRTPLQILFLILVTDLPPAIALGMEPGAKDILKERPRPKKQPIVLKWMWQSIMVNGAILSVVIIIVFIIACNYYVGSLSINDITEMIQEERMLGLTTTSDQLRKARTTAFISVVWSENVRAYTSRSFDRPFFENLLTNTAMQKAIGMAQSALYLVIFTPVISKDIFGLEGGIIGADGWLLAIAGSVFCLLFCELYKFVSKEQIKRFRKRIQEQQEAEEDERLAKFAKFAKQPSQKSTQISAPEIMGA